VIARRNHAGCGWFECYGKKFAVTVLAEFIVTLHVIPFTASHPVHPVKMESTSGFAVRVTLELLLNAPEQVPPQLMPAGFDVMVPFPIRPDLFTVSMYCTMKLAALVAVPPGAVTLSGPLVAPAGTEV
jgi:hypothetical protein